MCLRGFDLLCGLTGQGFTGGAQGAPGVGMAETRHRCRKVFPGPIEHIRAPRPYLGPDAAPFGWRNTQANCGS
ncbi:hypothetical protein OK074_1821 [Actinobacteria bacterium OK074]|nr:hypothetical protein OK074_1821 [Actinobacteria bacterium OK074]